ncbi:MAG TPA: protease HtpX [Thermoanaerobaculia bacterium]|nr:protease HtpX [Thermoanaerobaculia bacterium]
MKIAKRVFLFVAVNVLVVATISIVLSVLGVRPYLTQRGLDLGSLAVFCLVWGFGGAFISLGLSRVMAKWGMGVKLIDPGTPDPTLQELVSTVHRLAQAAGLRTMPQVGVYDSDEVNAFATGPTKNRSLVAVSTGLLRRLRRDEVEGVLGHEIAHVANGDMVTMTLVQGVVNAFTMFLARVLAFFVAQLFRRDEEGGGVSHIVYFVATLVFDIAFSILGSVVVAWFSRLREFRADAGGAQLAGRDRMVGALEALQRTYGIVDPADSQAAVQTLKISGHPRGLMKFFSTHPPLETRIARLKTMV